MTQGGSIQILFKNIQTYRGLVFLSLRTSSEFCGQQDKHDLNFFFSWLKHFIIHRLCTIIVVISIISITIVFSWHFNSFQYIFP